ncbi:glycosyl hydrolase, family 88 [Powellomyces hirtus]|nr:glycosyl hydrolase, family 88 [Powellomyces hirtus]
MAAAAVPNVVSNFPPKAAGDLPPTPIYRVTEKTSTKKPAAKAVPKRKPGPKRVARPAKKNVGLTVGINATQILPKLLLANEYFMKKQPNPGAVYNKQPSNVWTRGVYFEGLMNLAKIASPKTSSQLIGYATKWGNSHRWNVAGRNKATRNADNQVAGQTYIELYKLAPQQKHRFNVIRRNIDLNMKTTPQPRDWWWIDAVQMALPLYTQIGVLTGDMRYHAYGYKLFLDTKVARGLWNEKDGLWWRDESYKFPKRKSPNGKNVYWSRGNGWVVAAMVRTLEQLPTSNVHATTGYRVEYETILKTMLKSLAARQRPDGFWNANLGDAKDFGGKETTGTALHLYGFAYAVRTGLVDRKTYMPVITKAWNAIQRESISNTGFLQWVQGVGADPSSSQPVTATRKPGFEDFGLGCVLLAGSEVYKLTHAPRGPTLTW